MEVQDIARALVETSSARLPLSHIDLTFARFDHAAAAIGRQITCTAEEWLQHRITAAASQWPELGNKKSLPGEVGAILAQRGTSPAQVGRRGGDVLGMTWLFLDFDAGQSSLGLRQQLSSIGMFFLATESSTSRYDGACAKWHLILPLARPKIFTAGTPPKALALWWQKAHEHIAARLCALGGLDFDAAPDDVAARSFPRLAFIPHAPAEDLRRQMAFPDGGRLLDLDGFLARTGFAEVEPAGAPPTDDLGSVRSRRQEVVVDEAEAEGDAHTTDDAPQPPRESFGPTPDESTGTLLYKALKYFDLVDSLVDEAAGKYLVLCPWREHHSSAKAGTANTAHSSVTIWASGDGAGDTGGFKCLHTGRGVVGECCQASAADVLRWARRHGIPSSILPDRPAWGGAEAPPPPPAVMSQAAAVAVELPPEFPGAPAEGSPPPDLRPRYEVRGPSRKVKIEVTGDAEAVARMRDLSIRAISAHPSFYRNDGKLWDLVEPETDLDRNGFAAKPWLRKSVGAHLEAELGVVSDWYFLHPKNGQEVATGVSGKAVGAVLAAGRYPGVRELHGVITTPVFRPDGTLLQQPGYDPSCSVIYRPQMRGIPLVSANPSRAELVAAKALLLGVVADFPFKCREVAQSVWLSTIFTRFLRFAGVNRAPMFVVSAGAAGSGKGLFVDTSAIISEGAMAWKRSKACDDAEIERAIGAAVKEEVAIACLDNIPRGMSLASPTLEAYLTTGVFTTREIGTSKNIRAVKGAWSDTQWWATGNGLTTAGDMSRRVLIVYIDDKTGRPEDRKVAVDNLEEWCQMHRPKLAAAALTLLAGFFAARRGGWRVKLPAFASFENWRLVRDAVVWCGLPDPYLARGREEDDADAAGEAHLLRHLRHLASGKAMTMQAAVDLLRKDCGSKSPQHGDAYRFLADAGVKLDSTSAAGASGSLGSYLRKFKGKAHKYAGETLQLQIGKDTAGCSCFCVDVVG